MKISKQFSALLAACAVAALVIYLGRDAAPLLRDAIRSIAEFGPLGPLLFVVLYIVACVLMLPGSAFTLGAGAVWGLWPGALYVGVGSMLGATAAFLVGRHLARGWVERKFSANPRLAALDDAVAREGWRIIFLTRLSPVFPFSLLNYTLGLTRVRLTSYFTATLIGMAPGIVMYTYLGTLAGDLVGGGERQPPSGVAWAFRLGGFAATALITIYIARIAKKALSKEL